MNRRRTREGMHYNIKNKVRKDTLYYIAQRVFGEIKDESVNLQNKKYQSEYKKIKEIRKLVIEAYPFEELKDIKKSGEELYRLIDNIYRTDELKKILKKKIGFEELDIYERREYFKSIEYCLGKDMLAKHPEYDEFKDTMKLLDGVDDIVQTVERDFDIIQFIDNNENDKEKVMGFINEYKDTMLKALYKLRGKMYIEKVKLQKRYDISDDEEDENIIVFKYNEVEEALKKDISIVNEKTILIDCMGKSGKEIKEEGYLTDLPISEVLYTNVKIRRK